MSAANTYTCNQAFEAMKRYLAPELDKLVRDKPIPKPEDGVLSVDKSLSRDSIGRMSRSKQASVLKFLGDLIAWLQTKQEDFQVNQRQHLTVDIAQGVLQILKSRSRQTSEQVNIGRYSFKVTPISDTRGTRRLCLEDTQKTNGENLYLSFEDKKDSPGTICFSTSWTTPESGSGSSNEEINFQGFSIKDFIDKCGTLK